MSVLEAGRLCGLVPDKEMSNIVRVLDMVQRRVQNFVKDLAALCGYPRFHGAPALALTDVPHAQGSQEDNLLSWDGILLAGGLGACPKHQPGLEVRRRKKRDLRRYQLYLRSRHMIVPCDSCGGYHKKFHLCPTCYDQTRYETQQVRKKLAEAGLDLSEETVFKYKDDNGRFTFGPNKRVFSVSDRERPVGWFNNNLWNR